MIRLLPKHLKPETMPFNIILLGDPAAGKATQGEYLVKKFNLYNADMVAELTLRRQEDKKLDQAMKKTVDQGKLLTTAIVRDYFRVLIAKVPSTQGILFNGQPRMLGEAKLLLTLLNKAQRTKLLVLYLSISFKETEKRVYSRRGYFDGKFGKRADDTPAGLKNRIRYYRTNVAQVINFFQGHGNLHKINGSGTPEMVHARIAKIIKKYSLTVS